MILPTNRIFFQTFAPEFLFDISNVFARAVKEKYSRSVVLN